MGLALVNCHLDEEGGDYSRDVRCLNVTHLSKRFMSKPCSKFFDNMKIILKYLNSLVSCDHREV